MSSIDIQYSVAVRNARADAVESTIGTGAVLQLRTGPKPANCAAAATGTLLVECVAPSDWMAPAVNGVKSKSGTWAGVATGQGDIGHYRILNAGKTTCHEQGPVTLAGGGGAATVSNLTVAIGQTVTVDTFTRTEPHA